MERTQKLIFAFQITAVAAIFLSLVDDICVYLLFHDLGVHVRDEADGELANDLMRDNSPESSFRESPLDAMQRKRRIPPAMHQDLLLKWKNNG